MNLVFFAHPTFLNSQSMVRFATMLSGGMEERGHSTEIWMPKPRFFNLPLPAFLRKWMGYIDQYIVFRFEVLSRLKGCTDDTIFVFTDQALGPWVPWIGKRKHVIHCHDFLAQRSALGQISENKTKWFGQKYQAYIRRGYRQGKNFISVSKKTQADLHEFLLQPPALSEVVYNGLNPAFAPGNTAAARELLGSRTGLDLLSGYVLHIGGNQWYKNRVGVVEIYSSYRKQGGSLPLLLIGHEPNAELKLAREQSDFKDDIHFLTDVKDDLLKTAYIGATVFVFPSLAEGFGWPIAEAMACGCPVMTTNEAPMTEVAGNAGFLIPRKPAAADKRMLWADEAGKILADIACLTGIARQESVDKGIENSKRFVLGQALDEIETVYRKVSLDREN